jgi:hypothetical protein
MVTIYTNNSFTVDVESNHTSVPAASYYSSALSDTPAENCSYSV